MVFSSVAFISVFLLTVFVLYTILPGIRLKNFLLIIFSLVFYSVGEPIYVILMLASAFINYIFGLWVAGRYKKMWLILNVIFNLSCLFVFKYINFIILQINNISYMDIKPLKLSMPIGISFFTFQAMSYVIDVYREECKPQKNFFNILLYISFFPQLIAGPIIKYHDMEKEISDRNQTVDDIEYGIRRFITGLSKKVLIANTLAVVVDKLMQQKYPWTSKAAWVMAVGYTLQIYFDFSGYSDMAIGMGRMFGFHFKENFNYPYSSDTIKEFWKRWHISLSTWFKEYVYIPLGGNRKGKVRTYVNKYIVFALTGIWHGANWTFLLWGLIHGTFSVLEETKHLNINKLRIKPIRYIYTWLVIIIAFVLFRADSIRQGLETIKHMFIWKTDAYTDSLLTSLVTPYNILIFILAIIFSFPVIKIFGDRLKNQKDGMLKAVLHMSSGVLLLVLLLLCMMSLASGSYNPFIYFRF